MIHLKASDAFDPAENLTYHGPKLLSIQDGNLCAECDESLSKPQGPGRKRPLKSLRETSAYCGYCAMWMRALEASAQDLKDARQDAAAESHPLIQTRFEPEDVHLQFASTHNWLLNSIEEKICWPHFGPIWATLDLDKARDSMHVNTNLFAPSDRDDATWLRIKDWVSRCESDHELCQLAKESSWKPLRLLRISPVPEPLRLKLIEGVDTPSQIEYLTLSHCWGGAIPIRLTKDTLESFKRSVPVQDLPQNFLDACEIVRKLGHEYLWIDSLCIIQDDPEDWAIEAGRMASVYGNSWLTISATAASNAHAGLYHSNTERNLASGLPVWVQRKWGGQFSGYYCVSDFRTWWSRLAKTPLNRRAWVLQERMISPRVLHLGLDQVAFECCTMSQNERLPCGDSSNDLVTSIKRFIMEARSCQLESFSFEDLFGNWNEIVRNYSHANVTFDKDRLVALGGIVDCFQEAFMELANFDTTQDNEADKAVQQKAQENISTDLSNLNMEETKDTSDRELDKQSAQGLFLAGLWRPRIEMQLVWRATSLVQRHQWSGNAPPAPGRRPKDFIAPTWSWCSIKDAYVEPQQASSIDIYFAKVLEVNINALPDSDPSDKSSGLKYCCAPGSSLRLRCSFLPIAGIAKTEGMLFFDFSKEKPSNFEVDSKNYWDIDYEDEKCREPIAIPIFADMGRVVNPLHGIIIDLREDENGHRYHVRMGAFVLEQPNDVKVFWEGVQRFDERYPEKGRPVDDLYRLVETAGKTGYERKEGVLQRIVEIR